MLSFVQLNKSHIDIELYEKIGESEQHERACHKICRNRFYC